MVPVVENYKSYVADRRVMAAVQDLLHRVPGGYLTELSGVVLTDGAALGKGKTGRVRGRKHRRSDCLGFYHSARRGQGATITLVIDNILAGYPRWCFRLGIVVDILLASTLYHEIGHHLDARIGSHARRGEAAADDWSERISRSVLGRKYWYLSLPVRCIRASMRAVTSAQRLIGRTLRSDDAPRS
jgi:hypothetical protein